MKVIFSAVALAATISAQTALADPPPRDSEVMSADAVAEIYAGKTQRFTEQVGGYYFEPGGALGALGGDDTFGYGRWWVENGGSLCIRITWRWAEDGDARRTDEDCWAHRTLGRLVFKQYNGNWYQFSGPQNESGTLVDGYRYWPQISELRAQYGG